MYRYTLFVSLGILVSASMPRLPPLACMYLTLWGAFIGLALGLGLFLRHSHSHSHSGSSLSADSTIGLTHNGSQPPIAFVGFVKARVCLPLLLWLLCLLLGFSYGVIANKQLLQKQLPDLLDRQIVTVEGVVTDLPTNTPRRQRLLLQYSHLSFDNLTRSDEVSAQVSVPISSKLWLSWYKPNHELKVGQRWVFKVRLRAPRGFVNPVGFDYQSWLLRKGITATGTIQQGALNNTSVYQAQPLASRLFLSFSIGLAKVRDHLRRWLDEAEEQGLIKRAGLMKALIIADKSALTAADWRLLQDTGTAHLMAISGLHIGLVALLGYYLGALGGRLINLLRGNMNSSNIADFSAAILACAYAALAGFSTPTLRALIMVISVQLFLRFRRVISKRECMSFALLAVVLVDPMAYWDMGFWMSFLAAAVLLMIYSGRQRFSPVPALLAGEPSGQKNSDHKLFMIEALRSQWYLFFALVMPVLWLLKRVSLLTPLANIIAIPVVALLVAPLLLLAVLLQSFNLGAAQALALYPLRWGDLILSLLWEFLTALRAYCAYFSEFVINRLPENTLFTGQTYLQGGQLLSGQLSYLALLVGLLGLLLILLPRGVPGRWLGYPLLLMAVVSGHLSDPVQAFGQDLKLTFFDVGQGMAVAVETAGKVLIYDAGPNYSEKFNAGEAIVSPYLDGSGNARIDTMIISHADADHSGGAVQLSQRHPVDLLLAPQSLIDCFSQGLEVCLPAGWHENNKKQKRTAQFLHTLRASSCTELKTWRWGLAKFKVYSAQTEAGPRLKRLRSGGRNNSSCLLQIEHAGVRILLTGDIEAVAERALLDSGLLPESLDWMSVPHHGSKTSSSQRFLQRLQPRNVIFQYGHNNAYGHPYKAVVQRYNALGSRILNVDDEGAIQLVISGSGQTRITRWRRDYAHFWYASPTGSTADL